jgi:TPP-dependent pyruvate/acetoin dehydrogenase alpha subunit
MGTFRVNAHTKTSDQGEIIKTDRDEADWMLGLVERLFRYLIVDPAADKKMHAAIDEKLKKANRKAI